MIYEHDTHTQTDRHRMTAYAALMHKIARQKLTVDDKLFHIFMTRSAKKKLLRILLEHRDLNSLNEWPLVPNTDYCLGSRIPQLKYKQVYIMSN